jgi:Helix-turn-helix domain
MRYRYRIEPTLPQQWMLARVFGCCRVVFNDALRVRGEAWRAGIKLSDSEIQRKVITQAKGTDERGWLTEVPSVALVQSVNDSRRAWRNFLDSHTGRRKGRKMGRPRMKAKKDHRQSFRLTRNGFSLRPSGCLFVAKVGEVPVRWSRQLPSEPSSVTIIREPDGHYYASFVVEVEPASAARGPASRGRCWHRLASHRRDERRAAYRHRQSEAFGPQAAQTAEVRAGESPPAERIGQQGEDTAQGRHHPQQGGEGATGLSPQAGFGAGSRKPSDPRRRPQHRGHG